MLWVGSEELRVGFHRAMIISFAVAVAALIVERRAWRRCADIFVLGTLGLLVWMFFVESPEFYVAVVSRLGQVYDDAGVQVLNPNDLGSQTGFAALIAFHGHGEEDRPWPKRARAAAAILLCAGTLATGSRGAITGLIIAVGVMLVRYPSARVPVLAAIIAVVGVSPLLASSDNQVAMLLTRMFEEGNVQSAGKRVEIWTAVIPTVSDSPLGLLLGTGTGGSARELAKFVDFNSIEVPLLDDGVRRVAAHNIYFQWLIEHGLLGACVGGFFLFDAIRSVKNGPRQLLVRNAAILVHVAVVGLTNDAALTSASVAWSSLNLAATFGSWGARERFDRRRAARRTTYP